MRLETGARLGVLEIVSPLGKGGMGEVYRARDTRLGRQVAVKVLPAEVGESPDRLARFEREARALAALNHPNVATLFSFEHDGPLHYLVMELVEGEPLSAILETGPLAPGRALQLFLQLAEGLEAAHQHGILHRDLKPSNLMVVADGTVESGERLKILDFGLAKELEAKPSEPDVAVSQPPTLTAEATRRGEVLGTGPYMSPEQAKGQAVDRRTDVWAFGVCLFEALTGARMFEGEDISDTLAAVLRAEIDWRDLPDETPPSVQRLLTRCLERDPRRRLRDIGDACLEIRSGLEELSAPQAAAGAAASVPRSPEKRLAPGMAIAAFVLAGLLGVVGWLLGSSAARDVTEAPRGVSRVLVSSPWSAKPSTVGSSLDIAISPDGRTVVYVATDGSGWSLYARPLDQLVGEVLVRSTDRLMNPFFSPDGKWVAYGAAGHLSKVSLAEHLVVELCDLAGDLVGGHWGENEQILFATANEQIERVSSRGGSRETLLAFDPERPNRAGWPQRLPDGEAVLFSVTDFTNAEDSGQIGLYFPSRDETEILLREGTAARYVAGHLLYGLAGSVRAVPFDLERLEVTGDPRLLVEGVTTKPSGAADFAVSEASSLVYVSGGAIDGGARNLVWVDRQGRETPIGAPARPYTVPRLSPDGSLLAVEIREENADVWIWSFGRQSLDRFTLSEAADGYPVWTTDGRSLLFASNREGRLKAYLRAADGSASARAIETGEAPVCPTSVSPTGELLLRYGLPDPSIAAAPYIAPGETRILVDTSVSETGGTLSRDGRWLAYQANESGRNEIYVRPYPDVDTARWQVSNGGGFEPVWGEKELFYRDSNSLWSVPFDAVEGFSAGQPVRLFSTVPYYSHNLVPAYDTTVDGQRFIMIRQQQAATESAAEVVLIDSWIGVLREDEAP